MGREWTEDEYWQTLDCGPHESTMSHVLFLWEEFASLLGEVQWGLLMYLVDKNLPGLRLILNLLKDEQDRQPRWFEY